ncbi:DegV family protein [Clostridium sp. AM42-4]|mgnify:FL=1|uniref:DegV family protein n=1 Tax=Clostridium sp. AM42-4 TaxID=2292305 RepID=UPI000E4CA56D|nr:DegV family protein [Clostridium sp. AM42-4]RHS83351.1 DegV family protein [Clostridium sp. AM42-4]
MRTTGIVTDSHSGISQGEAQKLGIFVLPMPFYMNETCYYEGVNITRAEFLERLGRLENISTSQPSPEAVMELWDKALETYQDILYIPISSGLSGSCQTAMMLAREEKYEGKVYVVDNGSVATPLHQSILDALELLETGCSAAEVKTRMEAVKTRAGIYIAVDDLKYLKHGGRISAGVALVGGLLNVKPVLHFDIGILELYKNCRGLKRAKQMMIEEVKKVIEQSYQREYEEGRLHIVAATSSGKEETDAWVNEIEAAFPGHKILCDDLSFGVTCHIGPGGLGIGYSCKP